MKFISSRNNKESLSFDQAVLRSMAEDGGLFIPEEFPKVNMEELYGLSYKDLAYQILSLYLDDYGKDELVGLINKAYDEKFPTNPAPLTKAGDYYFLELYHGRTLAFKDFALVILPLFIQRAIEKEGLKEKILVLTATSGDTGSAALAGFSNLRNIDIIVFFPHDGVSKIQRLQMTTQEGDNVGVFSINGNFDDAQGRVKEIFKDPEVNKLIGDLGYRFSSANSINIGRLLPQIVYYFHAYNQLVERGEISKGEKISFVVPSGNFGDILAGYYGKKMGLPVEKLIIASNENKVLTDFFTTGTYDANRGLILTNSPSMDIIISSNLERLIYDKLQDGDKVVKIENDLSEKKSFHLDEDFEDFFAGFADEEETLGQIRETFEKDGYLIDTHTGVARKVAKDYESKRKTKEKLVILSTASPYKFSSSVIKALGLKEDRDAFESCQRIEKYTRTPVPDQINNLKDKKILHENKVEVKQMKDAIIDYLGEKNEN